MRTRLVPAVAGLVLVASLLGLRRAADAIYHYPVTLAGGVPAIVYEPGSPRAWTEARSFEERLPVVVLAHGFSASTTMMSSLARRLARSGYAVVTFDFQGHGRNPAPLEQSMGGANAALREDVDAAVLFARTQPHFDPERVAVAGHSMGAFAVLDYASFDPSVAAVIAISGASDLAGPHTPPNALLIWASRDPAGLRQRARETAASLAGLHHVVLDRTYGDTERGTGLRTTEVGLHDHVTILYSGEAARRIVGWLEKTVGAGANAPDTAADGRFLWALLGMIAALVLFWPLVSQLAPLAPRAESPAIDPIEGLTVLVGSMVGSVLILSGVDALASRGPLGFIPVLVVSDLVAFFLLSGGIMAVVLARRHALELRGLLDPATLLVSALLVLVIYVVLGALLQPFIGIWLAPPRVVWALLVAALVLPFFAGFEILLRAPGLRGVWVCAAGRLLTLVIILLGALLDLLPGFLVLTLGGFLVWFLLFEILAYRLRNAAPNPWIVALITAAWTGWTTVSIFPLVHS